MKRINLTAVSIVLMTKRLHEKNRTMVLLPLIAISTVIGIASLQAIVGPAFMLDLQVWAQVPSTSLTTTPAPSSNTDGQQSQQREIIQQGIATSSTDPLPGHEEHQSVTILRLRNDNAVYSGVLTFIATQPAEVQVLHRNMTANTTIPIIAEEFGTLSMLPLPGGAGMVTISNIIPQYPEDATTFAASVPFSGNAVALHNIEGEPFAASYTVAAAVLGVAQRADDIGPAPTTTEEEEDAEN